MLLSRTKQKRGAKASRDNARSNRVTEGFDFFPEKAHMKTESPHEVESVKN